MTFRSQAGARGVTTAWQYQAGPSQTENLVEYLDENAAVVASISPAGAVSALSVTGGRPVQVASGDGAITLKDGLVRITKGTAAALTLAAPAAADDGKVLVIMSETAAAHSVTNSSPGFNGGGGAKDVATFGAAIGNNLVVIAGSGKWWMVSQIGVTLG